MQNKTLFSLLIVTALVIGAGWNVFNKDNAVVEADSSLLFADLAARVNDVVEVSAESGEDKVTLRNQDGDWVLVERGDFPVDFSKVQELVVKLARLEIEEPKTAKPENHALLGVEDPGAEDSKSQRVTLRDSSGAVIASAIVGNSKAHRNSPSVFVRRDGEDQVFLCKGRINVDPTPMHWIEREILRIESKRIESVQILHENGDEVLIGRSSEDAMKFSVENLPEDREETYAGIAGAVASPLTYLQLDDVRPLSEVDFSAEPVATTTFVCKDGLVMIAKTAMVDDVTWIHLTAVYNEPTLVGPIVDLEPEAEAGTEEDAALESSPAGESEGPTPDEVRSEAEELNGRLSQWAFAIPSYKAEVFARKLEDLLKDLDAEPEPAQLPDDLPLSMEDFFDTGAAVDLFNADSEESSAGTDSTDEPATENEPE